MKQINSNIIRQVLLLAGIVFLGVLLFTELKFFIPALLGAYTLYVILRKYMFILIGKYNWKPGLTAALLMLITFVVILFPIMMVVNMMSAKVTYAISHSSEVLKKIHGFIQVYEKKWGFEMLTDENINKISDWAATRLPLILNATLNTITTLAMMYFILYFMLINGRKMETGIYKWMPVKDENIVIIRKDLNSMVISNAVGIPVIALAQGLVGLLGYYIIGVDQPIFWFVITSITAMLPVIGAALAYVPLGLLLFANGDTGKGIIILLYGFMVIGLVDNVFRLWFNKKFGNIHPLITIFGVIIGVSLFGFIGLIFGPILISLFLILVKIYSNEYGAHPHSMDEVKDS